MPSENPEELTAEQLARQAFIYDRIYDLLLELQPGEVFFPSDVASIRDEIFNIIDSYSLYSL